MFNPSRRPLLSRNCPGLDRSRPTRRIRRSVPKRHRPKWLRRTRVRNTRAVPSRSLTCCRKRVRNSLLSKFRWLKSSMRVLQMGSLLLAFLKASHTALLGHRARQSRAKRMRLHWPASRPDPTPRQPQLHASAKNWLCSRDCRRCVTGTASIPRVVSRPDPGMSDKPESASAKGVTDQ